MAVAKLYPEPENGARELKPCSAKCYMIMVTMRLRGACETP